MSTSLPEFAYDNFVASEELGGGTFGIVSCGTYNGETVVVKKLNAIRSYTNAGKKVLKEAGIAYSLKNKHINNFRGVCMNPLALMFDYECFTFLPWNFDEQVHNLEMLIEFSDYHAVENILLELMPHILQSASSAIAYLHANDVVHRDMKPSNILVSNLHYMKIEDPVERGDTKKEPIRCILADFEEAR